MSNIELLTCHEVMRLTADHITRRGEPRQPGYVHGDPAGTLWSRVSEIAKGAEPDAKPGPV
ncbi:hypothetical protein GRI38_09880 [Altererythrobacter aurantiacus]|uniref:Uncharacterized protein n=1 Tax=Parapontixanthobacter aurantiacus TaxID=1463599 RepID=A0A844ZFK7_9SPHN|nr:hypothetical protein [Parapontixanthobacter aurantiacus]MXO86334.1 hypothetical protein [Parapontixanthobacter aurantiacus]